ncbi:efflux RND transporter periplasmic adaptor subunit [Ectothiorhodospira variabilis]|uniref:efflux RND transporter periplasmic adaptor subunit n=1 Tax=Ectothiorhodospira variabilis TaxID=505694 RepID=UPI001EFB5FA3|nr:efflux RND transporter periplasmic adaptor subunit [Ectothiorhodospira variabilis]MCG5494281.1 efflux RND transporter periplasmic adaptor subunit [Ectothiorhodospira variabilis]MCG5504048.1 efflux RND transporter periplasmic adaptor subunit [Ectothiorhodospira variabilis]MCG5507203.1 efflux RND transporter periplasmic adaptor subunit [Ectothiorhodospira variabilis]
MPNHTTPTRDAIGLLLLVLAATMLLGACDQPPEMREDPPERPVLALILEPPEDMTSRTFSARAEAAERTALAFRVSGQVVLVHADLGDRVMEGDVLARLDDRDYRLKVRELEGQLEAAEGQLEEAEVNYRRGQDLVRDGTISRADYDGLRSAFRQAQGQRDAAREGLSTARAALEDTVLRAPFDAHVARRNIEPHEQASPERVVFVLDDLEEIELRVGMPETLVVHRDRLTAVDVHFAALGRRYAGRVRAVGVDVDEDTQTYPVRIVVDNPDQRILPGMTARLDFRAGLPEADEQGYFHVPMTAVFDHEGQPHVWVLDEAGETVTRRPVSLGPLERDGVRVLGDLHAGQQVVTAGVQHLSEGQTVRVLTEDEMRGARR